MVLTLAGVVSVELGGQMMSCVFQGLNSYLNASKTKLFIVYFSLFASYQHMTDANLQGSKSCIFWV